MNTYFFVRVRLRRDQGRRSFIYGPYAEISHAEDIIGNVPEILQAQGIKATKYNIYIEERCPERGNASWTKVNTRTKLVVEDQMMLAESELVTIEVQTNTESEKT